MTRIKYEDDHGIYSIEVKEELSKCEHIIDVMDWCIKPLLRVIGFNEKVIEDYFEEN